MFLDTKPYSFHTHSLRSSNQLHDWLMNGGDDPVIWCRTYMVPGTDYFSQKGIIDGLPLGCEVLPLCLSLLLGQALMSVLTRSRFLKGCAP